MRLLACYLILFGLLFTKPCYALLDSLPFLGTQFPFQIQLPEQKQLTDALSDTLQETRKQSSEFKLYTDVASAIHFDRAVLKKALESRGYYLSKVISKNNGEQILHQVQPGPIYRVATIEMKFPKGIEPPSLYLLPIQEGAPLNAERVLQTVQSIKDYLQADYCLYQINVSYQAAIDHSKQEGYLNFTVAQSQNVKFGTPQVFGEVTVAHAYLAKQIPFKKGECFNRTVIEKSRLALLQTNLVAKVDTTVAEPIAGEVVVTFQVTERSHRTIKAGAGYATDIGPSLLLGWEHRNLFGAGQKFETTLNLSQEEQTLDASLTLPNFLRDDQVMLIESSLERKQTDAYDSSSSETTATISRGLRKHLTGSVGVGFEFSHVQADGEVDDYGLLSFPVGLDYNSTDNIFDPRRGITAALKARPYINMYQTGERFLERSYLFSTYYSKKDWPAQPTLAFRLAAGTLTDAGFDEIPVDHRFYVGGGGSVRGYEYESISDLDEEDTPIGGLSFSETSLELRLQFSKSWGAVLFTDGGYAFRSQSPKFFEDYLWSAGIGIRFYTNFAPIRFDIARPLDIRYGEVTGKRIDSPYQLYISIGQAF